MGFAGRRNRETGGMKTDDYYTRKTYRLSINFFPNGFISSVVLVSSWTLATRAMATTDEEPPSTTSKSHLSAKSTRSRRSQLSQAESEPPASAPALAPADLAIEAEYYVGYEYATHARYVWIRVWVTCLLSLVKFVQICSIVSIVSSMLSFYSGRREGGQRRHVRVASEYGGAHYGRLRRESPRNTRRRGPSMATCACARCAVLTRYMYILSFSYNLNYLRP